MKPWCSPKVISSSMEDSLKARRQLLVRFRSFRFFLAGCILVVIQSVPKRIAVGGHLAESSVSTYRRRVYLALYDRRDKHTGYYRIYFSFRNRHA